MVINSIRGTESNILPDIDILQAPEFHHEFSIQDLTIRAVPKPYQSNVSYIYCQLIERDIYIN